MDPRMDSGVILDEQKDRPPFESTRHLLPEELCWVMDRLTACEVRVRFEFLCVRILG